MRPSIPKVLESGRAYDLDLGVELLPAVDVCLDLARPDGLGDDRDAGKPVLEGFPGPLGDLAAHQDANAVQLLPLFVECEKRADLKPVAMSRAHQSWR